ncbi:hypothetical protein MSAN_00527700 [Mycena sanguinolenta]|uniref:Uncharacterized protein n=1 Tax=Mycena sanguinolenta TaxID=230812 RepID=A0A8H6ZBD0_9AGAR|nr:hypothetical protein MSAN_00527700 [Mycena sanguinolenta]
MRRGLLLSRARYIWLHKSHRAWHACVALAHEHDSPVHPHIEASRLPRDLEHADTPSPVIKHTARRARRNSRCVAHRTHPDRILQHTSCPGAHLARQSTPHALRATPCLPTLRFSRTATKNLPSAQYALPRGFGETEAETRVPGRAVHERRAQMDRPCVAHTSSRLQFARSAPIARELDVAASDPLLGFHASTAMPPKEDAGAPSCACTYYPAYISAVRSSPAPRSRRPPCTATSLRTFTAPRASSDTNRSITPDLLTEVCLYIRYRDLVSPRRFHLLPFAPYPSIRPVPVPASRSEHTLAMTATAYGIRSSRQRRRRRSRSRGADTHDRLGTPYAPKPCRRFRGTDCAPRVRAPASCICSRVAPRTPLHDGVVDEVERPEFSTSASFAACGRGVRRPARGDSCAPVLAGSTCVDGTVHRAAAACVLFSRVTPGMHSASRGRTARAGIASPLWCESRRCYVA